MKILLTKTVSVFALCMAFPAISVAQTDQECADKMLMICGDQDANNCAALEEQIGQACLGYAYTMIEMARESDAEMAMEGASLGGTVRSGAGTDFSKVGSLAEGALIDLEENTNVMMDGYPWFKITQYNDVGGVVLSGYQWGGIVCSFQARDGVFNTCPPGWSAFNTASSVGEDAIAPFHGGDAEHSMEQPIAPVHGNSDEDNEMIALETVSACLDSAQSNGVDSAACIGQVSDACLEDGNDYTTMGMRQCISLEHSAWDSLLNTDYKKLMASVDSDAKRTKVQNAQRHWIKFVDSFCSLGYELNKGTLYLVSGDQCRLEMTARQDLELRKLLGPEY